MPGNYISIKNFLYLIIRFILLIQSVITGKISCNFLFLKEFPNQFLSDFHLQFLITFQYFGKVLPTSGSHKKLAIYCIFHHIKILFFKGKIGQNCAMYALFPRIFQPYICICLYGNLSYTIQRNNVKFPDRFVVCRRIASSYNNPSLRYLMGSKGLVLQKLQHSRGQRLRHAIDLIYKKDSLLFSRLFHVLIHRSNNFTHGVFCYINFRTTVIPGDNFGKSHCTLTSMMRDGVSHQAHLTFGCNLLHNCSFPDSRRTDQKDWALPYQRIGINSIPVLFQISSKGMDNLIFCVFDIHIFVLSPITSL